MTGIGPKFLLRIEGLIVLLASCIVYRELGASLAMFSVLFLAPDIFMLGYLFGKKTGAHAYNFAHTYSTPMVLGCGGYFAERTTLVAIAVIWVAHIGIDRLLGYGLKYETDFKSTHLQRV
jgi:hypothetical protein